MMARNRVSREVVIRNPQGFHLRPAHEFVTLASRFAAEVALRKEGSEPVDGKSILSILTLAASAGSRLVIEADGEDATEAVEALASLVEEGFTETGV